MTDWFLDDTMYFGMNEAVIDQETLEGGLRTGIGGVDSLTDRTHWGHHKIRRALSPMYQVPIWLAKIGLISKENQRVLQSIYLASSAVIGGYLIYWSIRNVYELYLARQTAIAAGETVFHITAQHYAGIALAASMAAAVAASFSISYVTGYNVGRGNITVEADYTTGIGRGAITKTVRGSLG
jgi:hypothetical protein